MHDLTESARKGHFARKQILCRDWLISWTHRRRFELGVELACQFAGKRVLDYGCGDGTFLAMLTASSSPPRGAVGCEREGAVVEDCRVRLGEHPGLSFILDADLDRSGHVGAYDAVFCLEVLEHVVDVEAVLDRFARLLVPSGHLVISVPVETGLPLVVKQVVRRVAGWRGLGDYPGQSPYTLREFLAGVFAGRSQHVGRPVHRGEDGNCFHDHKGFNWMAFREILVQRFHVEKTLSSPLTWLPPHLASQVWFVARKGFD